MNFKKTLVALAMAGFASGAMASDVQIDTQDVWTLSAEGIQAGEVENFDSNLTTGTVLDFYLDTEIPASGTVSVKFDAGFDLSTVDTEIGTISNGSGVGTLSGAQSLQINYGSASFTFVSYTWDKDTQTLTLKLGNGQPLLGGASFGLVGFKATDKMVGIASVEVTSAKFDGSQIEQFQATLSQTAPQFAVKTGAVVMDGVVEAGATRDRFVSGAVGSVDNDTNEHGELVLVDMASELKANATITGMDVTLLGDFVDEDGVKWAGDFDLSNGTISAGVTNTTDTTKVELALANPTGVSAGTAYTFSYDASTSAKEQLVTPFQVAADLEISGITDAVNYLPQTGFGSWGLEDGVINVPYLPVGFPGLSANVEISNESTEDAIIYVEAFNQEGEYFARTPLTQVAAGQTVTKVSAQDLINAFGLTGKNKLSVTFSFDIDGVEGADGITLAPYYRQNESRINVLSDEYKGK